MGSRAGDTEDEKKTSSSGVFRTLMVRFPVLMNGLQGGVLSGLSVVTKQLLFGASSMAEIDWAEVCQFSFISCFVVTPLVIPWMKALYSRPLPMPVQLLADAIYCGIFVNAVFVAALVLTKAVQDPLCGSPQSLLLESCQSHLAAQLPEIHSAVFSYGFLEKFALGSQKLWLPAKIAMVLFIPPVFHGVWCNVVNFIWTVILASLATSA
uniref:Uncharacterized protein n=1 Tax=Rhizochromulina marina TaxID=1034831 RepID=A0A7S2S8M7_9STRA|mmetsp:Transcript_26723/g.77777  ORF Transcript_26723/g.77777 Transcript_26723/m.77777 type:complete len:209 (+) Transcript_26723:57-683(+)